MKEEAVKTFWVKIYISGPIGVIEQLCRQHCLEDGLCVTVAPTKFIYPGGEEDGVGVGLINYPRFPKSNSEVLTQARVLADELLRGSCQHSVLLMSPHETVWITKRESP